MAEINVTFDNAERFALEEAGWVFTWIMSNAAVLSILCDVDDLSPTAYAKAHAPGVALELEGSLDDIPNDVDRNKFAELLTILRSRTDIRNIFFNPY